MDRPELVRELLERTAPHFPVQRYFQSGAEMRAQSGPAALIIAPNFRADWATADSRSATDRAVPGDRASSRRLPGCSRAISCPWGVCQHHLAAFRLTSAATDVPPSSASTAGAIHLAALP
jgi:hypothetical protein